MKDAYEFAYPRGRKTVDEALSRKPFSVRTDKTDVFEKITDKRQAPRHSRKER